jgi:hypothetical protein
MKLSFILLSLFFLSCGKNVSEGKENEILVEYERPLTVEYYRGILRPMNNHLSGFLPSGIAEVKIDQKEMTIKTFLDDDAKVTHIQSIHVGNKCPEISDDKNLDGIIDMKEGLMASGKVYVSLDSDINSEALGEGLYPMGGGYTYIEKANLKKFHEDLQIRNLELDFLDRVVIIFGTYKKNNLPQTIDSLGIYPVEKSLPIACGVLRKLEWIRPTRWQER